MTQNFSVSSVKYKNLPNHLRTPATGVGGNFVKSIEVKHTLETSNKGDKFTEYIEEQSLVKPGLSRIGTIERTISTNKDREENVQPQPSTSKINYSLPKTLRSKNEERAKIAAIAKGLLTKSRIHQIMTNELNEDSSDLEKYNSYEESKANNTDEREDLIKAKKDYIRQLDFDLSQMNAYETDPNDIDTHMEELRKIFLQHKREIKHKYFGNSKSQRYFDDRQPEGDFDQLKWLDAADDKYQKKMNYALKHMKATGESQEIMENYFVGLRKEYEKEINEILTDERYLKGRKKGNRFYIPEEESEQIILSTPNYLNNPNDLTRISEISEPSFHDDHEYTVTSTVRTPPKEIMNASDMMETELMNAYAKYSKEAEDVYKKVSVGEESIDEILEELEFLGQEHLAERDAIQQKYTKEPIHTIYDEDRLQQLIGPRRQELQKAAALKKEYRRGLIAKPNRLGKTPQKMKVPSNISNIPKPMERKKIRELSSPQQQQYIQQKRRIDENRLRKIQEPTSVGQKKFGQTPENRQMIRPSKIHRAYIQKPKSTETFIGQLNKFSTGGNFNLSVSDEALLIQQERDLNLQEKDRIEKSSYSLNVPKYSNKDPKRPAKLKSSTQNTTKKILSEQRPPSSAHTVKSVSSTSKTPITTATYRRAVEAAQRRQNVEKDKIDRKKYEEELRKLNKERVLERNRDTAKLMRKESDIQLKQRRVQAGLTPAIKKKSTNAEKKIFTGKIPFTIDEKKEMSVLDKSRKKQVPKTPQKSLSSYKAPSNSLTVDNKKKGSRSPELTDLEKRKLQQLNNERLKRQAKIQELLKIEQEKLNAENEYLFGETEMDKSSIGPRSIEETEFQTLPNVPIDYILPHQREQEPDIPESTRIIKDLGNKIRIDLELSKIKSQYNKNIVSDMRKSVQSKLQKIRDENQFSRFEVDRTPKEMDYLRPDYKMESSKRSALLGLIDKYVEEGKSGSRNGEKIKRRVPFTTSTAKKEGTHIFPGFNREAETLRESEPSFVSHLLNLEENGVSLHDEPKSVMHKILPGSLAVEKLIDVTGFTQLTPGSLIPQNIPTTEINLIDPIDAETTEITIRSVNYPMPSDGLASRKLEGLNPLEENKFTKDKLSNNQSDMSLPECGIELGSFRVQNLFQMRGSNVPNWFPGYFNVLPGDGSEIHCTKSPSDAMIKAWYKMQPTDA